MAELVLKWDTSKVRFLEAKGARFTRALVKTMRMSGRDAIRAARTDFQRYVRARKRFKVRTVRSALKVVYPRSDVGPEQMAWVMIVSGKNVPLAEFPHRQVKRGVSVAVNKGGKRVLIKGAFVATMKSGKYGIWERMASQEHGPMTKQVSKSTDFFRVGRLPINHLLSTRVSDVFQDTGVPGRLFDRAQTTFTSTFDRVLELELAKVA